MGKTLGKAQAAITTGGASLFGLNKGKDLLFGKKDPGVADRYLELDPSLQRVNEAGRAQQERSLGLFGGELDRFKGMPSAEKLTSLSIANQERQARSGAEDIKRKTSELVAQRGLGSSSQGLRAILGTERNLANQLGQIRAQSPLLQQQFQSQRIGQLGQISGGINSVLGARGAERPFVQGRESTGRGGGLLGVGLGAVGAYYGGPGGAQAGFGAGRSIANL